MQAFPGLDELDLSMLEIAGNASQQKMERMAKVNIFRSPVAVTCIVGYKARSALSNGVSLV